MYDKKRVEVLCTVGILEGRKMAIEPACIILRWPRVALACNTTIENQDGQSGKLGISETA